MFDRDSTQTTIAERLTTVRLVSMSARYREKLDTVKYAFYYFRQSDSTADLICSVQFLRVFAQTIDIYVYV